MYITDMIVGLAGGLFMLTAFIYFLRLVQTWLLHRTLRDAIQRDSAVAATLIERIDHSDRGQELGGDDRSGMVLIAIGVALIGCALIVDDPSWERYGIGGALFPILVGLALLVRHLWLRHILERGIAAGS
jgi:hypothetical protein